MAAEAPVSTADYLFPSLKPAAPPSFMHSSLASSHNSVGHSGLRSMLQQQPPQPTLRPQPYPSHAPHHHQQQQQPFRADYGGDGGDGDEHVPLFQRRTEDEARAQQLGDGESRQEVERLRRQLREIRRRLGEIEHINVNLEERLQHQARVHVADAREKDASLSAARAERDAARQEVNKWKRDFALKIRECDRAAEQLRRAEKELYRMHQRKYELLEARPGESKADASRRMPPGFPVPREVSFGVNGGSVTQVRQVQGQHQHWQQQQQGHQSSWAMAKAMRSNSPCHVHGRVGCPCAGLAFESNRASGIDSLADFLGIGGGSAGGGADAAGLRTPQMRPQGSGYGAVESPGGLSLKDVR